MCNGGVAWEIDCTPPPRGRLMLYVPGPVRQVFTLLALWGLAAPAHAQDERPLMSVARRQGAIRIDGVLDEAAWASADVGDSFVERLPVPGAVPPVRTEVRVLVDSTSIYVGVTSYLAPGEVPRALELTRDSYRIWDDDAVTVKLDVRRDRRSTVGFAVNPAGTQIDFIALDNGRVFLRQVDSVWESATSVRDDAWIAEFRIPAAALRLPPGGDHRVFGFNVSRDHNARQATYDWSHLPPEFGAASALHYGDIELETPIGGGRPLIVNPYLSLAWPAPSAWGPLPLEPKAGGELRLRLTDDVWGELTLSTDFAEVDLDSQVVNLDRFPLFFPERRPFFLTGLDVFTFGALEEAQLFFTRRIGLDADANPVPIYGGIKLYGREGFLSFGILDVMTAAADGTPAANWGVARVRANIGDASYVGVLFGSRANVSGREFFFDTVEPDPHWTVGVDGLVRALDGDRLELRGFGAFTATEGLEPTEGFAGRAEIRWRGENWTPSASGLFIQEGFDPELGFVRRPAIFQANAVVPWISRAPADGLRSFWVSSSGRVETSDDFEELLRLSGGWAVGLVTTDRWSFSANGNYVQDVVREPFDLVPDLSIEPGQYRGVSMNANVASPNGRNPVVSLTVGANNAFFGGASYRGILSFAAAFGPHFRTSIGAVGALLDFPERDLIPTLAINSVFSVTPSPWVLVDLVGQLNSVAERFIAMLRVRWRYLPGSDLFLVYREALDYSGPEVQSERRVTLKVSYRYDTML